MSGAVQGLMEGELCTRLERVCSGLLYSTTGGGEKKKKTTQPRLKFPTPRLTLDRGVLLPAPVPRRIAALFGFPPLPPLHFATGILSPKFCLKLDRLKGRLEFHGNLLCIGDTS